MDLDPLTVALNMFDSLHLTPDDIRRLADLRERGVPTLRQVLEDLVCAGKEPAAQLYPQGLRRVLDGDPDLGSGSELTAYGDLAFTELTLPRLRKDVHVLHRLVGERQVARAAARGRPYAADAPKLHGHGAVEQYIRAARAIDGTLADNGIITGRRLTKLADPDRPGPSRDQSLEDTELREYLQVVLWFSDDPLLDALLWVTDRVGALRVDELITLTETGAHPDRPSVTVAGKGSKIREAPVHAPVLQLATQLSAQRPGHGSNRLFRTDDGHPVTVKRFEGWSEQLHQSCPWAAGHDMRLHVLRHTTAQAVAASGGAHAAGAALYLGHKPKVSLGTIATYLGLTSATSARQWTLTTTLATNAFGPLEDWPQLPENDVLADVLPLPVRHG